MKRIHAVLTLLMVLLMATAIALPLMAQDTVETPDNLVLVTGAVDLSSGNIVVANYIIAPAGAFMPSILQQGDIVIITGILLPDGLTIQALTFELFIEPEVTPTVTPMFTPTVTPEMTPEVTPEVTPEITPEVTPEATPIVELCNRPNQPVAMRISEAFDVDYQIIINYHCSGFGFGEITRAYLLAEQTGLDVQVYFDLRGSGEGWGQIVREAGVSPSQLAPGQVHRGGYDADGNNNGNGNNGNGNGNGNNGNGRPECPGNSCNAGNNGNGNGNNGNGNGNGNGNNGNGRGNGNGNN